MDAGRPAEPLTVHLTRGRPFRWVLRRRDPATGGETGWGVPVVLRFSSGHEWVAGISGALASFDVPASVVAAVTGQPRREVDLYVGDVLWGAGKVVVWL